MKLLHIIASPRGEQSRTLGVSNEFLKSLAHQYDALEVEELDLFRTTLPEIVGPMVDAKYAAITGSLEGETKAAWEETAKFAQHFLSFDIYLISNPIWNFSIPYKLKHYIDVIVQPGLMFQYTDKGVEGLAKDKKMFIVTSRGSDYSEGNPMKHYDFQEPYLKTIFGFIGIHDITFIHAQAMDFHPDVTESNLARAKEEAKNSAENYKW